MQLIRNPMDEIKMSKTGALISIIAFAIADEQQKPDFYSVFIHK